MATTVKQTEQGAEVSLLTTELNSLANNTNVVSSVGGTSGVFANTQGTTSFDGYVEGKVELNLGAPSTTVTANTDVQLWFLLAVDGTNYEDGGASVTPARLPDLVIPLRAVSTAQRVARRCLIPVGSFKVLLRNNGTGVTLAASGNTVKVKLSSHQGV